MLDSEEPHEQRSARSPARLHPPDQHDANAVAEAMIRAAWSRFATWPRLQLAERQSGGGAGHDRVLGQRVLDLAVEHVLDSDALRGRSWTNWAPSTALAASGPEHQLGLGAVGGGQPGAARHRPRLLGRILQLASAPGTGSNIATDLPVARNRAVSCGRSGRRRERRRE